MKGVGDEAAKSRRERDEMRNRANRRAQPSPGIPQPCQKSPWEEVLAAHLGHLVPPATSPLGSPGSVA